MKTVIAGISMIATMLAGEPAVVSQTEVAEAVVGTSVVDRAPQGAASTFSRDVGTLYCFTRITGSDGETVEHVWYHEGQEMARVPLQIGGPDWRTWSTKRVVSDWTGSWRVDIQLGDGSVLQSVSFTVQ